MAAIPLVSAASLMPIQELLKTPLQRYTLRNNPRKDDEINVLARLKSSSPVIPQTICFTDLPAEIRNRIHGYILPSEDHEIIIATPFEDEAMAFGTQPAITRVSRQLRSETLEMFYTTANFVAYIKDFDFLRFIHWARCITSSPLPVPKITVQVKLLTRITCAFELRELVRDWRDLDHTNLHLKIHNCYCSALPLHGSTFDQRKIVVRAIHVAEELRAKGEYREEAMLQRMKDSIDSHTNPSCTWAGDSCWEHKSVFLPEIEKGRGPDSEHPIGSIQVVHCSFGLGYSQEESRRRSVPWGRTAEYGYTQDELGHFRSLRSG